MNYESIWLKVQTNDGFKLTIQHIPHGLAGSIGSKEAPVFLQHGIMAVNNLPNEVVLSIQAVPTMHSNRICWT